VPAPQPDNNMASKLGSIENNMAMAKQEIKDTIHLF
jgi:hypothetical protein